MCPVRPSGNWIFSGDRLDEAGTEEIRATGGLPGEHHVPGTWSPPPMANLLSGQWLTGGEGLEHLCRGRLGSHQIGDTALFGADDGERH